ncbi:MAG: N-acetyl-gamma-glutamyl-phosphate reductase [Defluviitaleaceae bacterium]|nr:N-acetyl-gamma-glutamyl-phosphate reductase [Defluviitaleaceae bacterium]
MKVFIDGQYGTTGLKLEERLRERADISLLQVDFDKREQFDAKLPLLKEADVVFLCLPDDAARESVAAASADTLIIDASTAHRTAAGWAYGFPELSPKHRNEIAASKRIAVNGCHACGFISLIYPLVSQNILPAGERLSCTSLTGYSGGGIALIDAHEKGRSPGDKFHSPRPYALNLAHKHLPEMKAVTGLDAPPIFYPVVGDMFQGMLVSVPLWPSQLSKKMTAQNLWETLAAHYEGSRFVQVKPFDINAATDGGFMDATACNGTNRLEIFVFGHDEQILLAARLDNLGKGASGAAVQCMNIACGLDEAMGLEQ